MNVKRGSGEGTKTDVKGSTGTAAGGGGTAMKVCHPSVCVGNVQPANCICPTTRK